MRSKKIFALVLLNVVLLATLCLPKLFVHTAQAIIPPRPSEYLMVTGEVNGGSSGLLFVVDTKNGLLSAFALNQTKQIDPMLPIDLKRVFPK